MPTYLYVFKMAKVLFLLLFTFNEEVHDRKKHNKHGVHPIRGIWSGNGQHIPSAMNHQKYIRLLWRDKLYQ